MNEIYPEDIRFSPEESKKIISDLYAYAFNCPRDARSEEYKAGFRAGAFNTLLLPKYKHLSTTSSFPKGSCQLDAWYSGYDEGQRAAHSFQINYVESIQHNEPVPTIKPEEGSGEQEVSFSFT
ncbi:hypothetical protein K7J14_07150 [Treponema zuelzerae]|uniref:Uncharacterized protein n=1 Tax=Teretinema zuelzerae TaxID=156 RepID=A0AAE3JHW8_9SPIR|nr:hypothetical protein [Teretinema zuelzerae]MCD1654417.1 hypothetical protein [Teretinema zuelzerae]MCD1654481.1 hypothetical protein [Teretinema zuelzerae]